MKLPTTFSIVEGVPPSTSHATPLQVPTPLSFLGQLDPMGEETVLVPTTLTVWTAQRVRDLQFPARLSGPQPIPRPAPIPRPPNQQTWAQLYGQPMAGSGWAPRRPAPAATAGAHPGVPLRVSVTQEPQVPNPTEEN